MQSPRRHPPLAAIILAIAAALPGLQACTAVAAPVPSQRGEEAIDPPGRVGRLSEVHGSVWLYHPEEGEWVAAERNRPLTSGDRLATDGGARTEVRIGSSVLRLDGASEIEVLNLDDDRMVLRLHSGSLAVRIRSADQVRGFELLTEEGRFTVQRPGRYRFDRADDASFATVLAGQAYYDTQNNALSINAGQRAEFWMDRAGAPQYSIVEPERDAFAGWVAERDRADERSAASRYVSPEMTGVEDLDRYGYWQDNPEYGALWVPRGVASGWAPYTTGRWVWVAPWGWTWVDEAPWGFAPFHYGRWVYVGSSWCWVPGTYVRRPVYAPALVAWIGGPHLSVGLTLGGGPAVGWVPLAPREVYVPTYRVSPGYVRNVNYTHVTNITNITTIVNNPQQAVAGRDFRNRKFPHAVTVVPASTLTAREPVAPVAARWRDTPAVREIATQPPRAAVVAAPPVATPPPAVRRPDAPVARPPGAIFQRGGDRPDVLRPASPAQPREAQPREPQQQPGAREPQQPVGRERERERVAPPLVRPAPQVQQPLQPAQPMQPAQPVQPMQPRQERFERPQQPAERMQPGERPQQPVPPMFRPQQQVQPQPQPQAAPRAAAPQQPPQQQQQQPPQQQQQPAPRHNGAERGLRDRPDVGNGRPGNPRQEN
ncbi:MAG: hypothetical protein E6Q93_25980 [Burkholderiaceae bacterium]|nr:MAG: hypothetical protein E6Q93_25980 [Burkholderiaceae bacterium]